MDAKVIKNMGDSQLMVKQLIGEYKCNNLVLMEFLELAHSLLQQFTKIKFSHVPLSDNEVANKLAQQALRFRLEVNDINNIEFAKTSKLEVKIGDKNSSSI